MTRIAVLAGGIGGARFLRGLRLAAPDADITVIANTGDDIWLFGLRVCPDLDTLMYTLGDGHDVERGWGRADETFHAAEELAAYGMQPDWFGLGDRDLATHLVRTQMIRADYPLSQVTEALCARWRPGVRLLPMTDDRVETHVVITDDAGRRAIHFQEWWVRLHAETPAEAFVMVGADEAVPGPGVVEALNGADLVLLPPSNPVVSIGSIMSVARIRAAVESTPAPVVGVSGIVGDRPVRGMADACLAAIDVPTTALGVATHYGSRRRGGADGQSHGLLDGWIVDDVDAASVPAIEALGLAARSRPTLMTDDAAAAELAAAALALGAELRGGHA